MMSLGTMCLTLFISVLSWHLSTSMELPIVAYAGTALSLLAGLKLVTVERPTWGLVFVLLATGAFMGNQILEDWAIEGSWPQDNGLGAGLVIGLLIYLLWVFAARQSEKIELALDRDTQTILVIGLLLLLLMAPAEQTIIFILDERIGLLTLLGILLASLSLLADRVGTQLVPRLLLFVPILLTVPVFNSLLEIGQRPVIAAIGTLMPNPSNFTPTGFSPSQQLSSRSFLRPSSRAVMRIRGEQYPGRYLVGNRLSFLDDELVWRPTVRSTQLLTTLDAELTESSDWRYPIENDVVSSYPPSDYTVHNLNSDYFVFMSPGTTHISGRFEEMSRDPTYSYVWTAEFDRGADRRWRVETGSNPQPSELEQQNLLLPVFWDDSLQAKAEEFRATQRTDTVSNLVNYFTSRRYSLSTNFDPDQPFHDFFLNDRAAYCFWFATGATLALRANGIPSRLVSGYAINEQISPDMWLVRNRDAHSWVEWQDEDGYWHTVDPTPASIESFFGGYRSSQVSQWYHYLAGQWQALIDWVLEDELIANLVRYGGVLILIFLFTREYRRLRGERQSLNNRARRWQKLWLRFIQKSNLPLQPSWTAATYADNLPGSWSDDARGAVLRFLDAYSSNRFSANDEAAIETVEKSLDSCIRALSESRSTLPT
ncbi:MAG: transglutaminase domain-containing protein [Pseudomonadales bacterium]|nr:transglutaminase domain-containing protein [Pseudomonadales bacterium]